MARAIASYYKGGHRVITGGVPMRVSYLPKHGGGKALMAQSSREMCLPLPPRGKAARAKWEADQRKAYDAATKLGNRLTDEVVMTDRKKDLQPVAPPVEPVQAIEPFRAAYRPPSRPTARRAAISGAMRTIHYYRVSTEKQGRSGLGLDAQRVAVEAYCAGRGCEMVAEYIEVESGKRNDRPELTKALHQARITGATLIISKLDRLSRNAAFLMTMRDAGVQFVCADMADANSLTIGVMALVAQQEREATSRRTIDALAAAKARGTKLGNPLGARAFGNSSRSGAMKSATVRRGQADAFARDVMPIIDDIRGEAGASLRQIAEELNRRGIMTARGAPWSAKVVRDVLLRSS